MIHGFTQTIVDSEYVVKGYYNTGLLLRGSGKDTRTRQKATVVKYENSAFASLGVRFGTL